MSAPERTAGAAAAGQATVAAVAGAGKLGVKRRLLCGWGRTSCSEAAVIAPRDFEQAREVVLGAGRHGGLIARGAGRSYGDAAQNRGGLVIDLAEIAHIELLPGPLLRVGAGAKLSQILTVLAGSRLTLPVVPGTRHITIGGAIAADIHGKNHRRDGSFGHHVLGMTLCTPDGALRQISREVEPELFYATLGGMGLTGVILEAMIAPSAPGGPLLDGDVDRVGSIEQALAVMRQDAAHRYSIAWVDLLSAGAAFGRCVVLRSNERPLPSGERGCGDAAAARVKLPGRSRLGVPERCPARLLSPATVRVFNALRWHRAPPSARRRPITAGENFFPLDALGNWNRLYGPGGLVQYQFTVPEQRSAALVEVVQHLRRARQPIYLAVIKRFGAPSGGMLSFPAPGWTLALDLPATAPCLHNALQEADELVVGAGGRVYLAKDARLSAPMLAAMYPQLPRFIEVREQVDPHGMLRSDMARRLRLLPGAAA